MTARPTTRDLGKLLREGSVLEPTQVWLPDLLLRLAQDPDVVLARRAWRLRLACGFLDEEAARTRLDAIAGRATQTAADVFDLGVLGAHPSLGWRARGLLAAALDDPQADTDALRIACARTHGALLEAREDDLAEAFHTRLVRESARLGHALAPVFFDSEWPPRGVRAPRRLELEDRRLRPGEP